MNNTHSILMVVIMSVVTILLRVLPFLVFGNKKTPKFIEYLGKYLPYAIMGMLVVYCLRNTVLLSSPFGIPEIIACLVVISVHIWKRKTLLSILSGTLVYVLFVQVIF